MESFQTFDLSEVTLESFIARGGYGDVYKAPYNDGRVPPEKILTAVKILDWGEDDGSAKTTALRANFLNEIDVWHKLDHPNIVKFIGATAGAPSITFKSHSGDLIKFDNVCCIVSEYQASGTLKSFLKNKSGAKLDFQTVIRFSIDLAEGLSYLHSKKVVHRDIKTDNILLGRGLTVKITDFGIAKEDPNEIGMTDFHGSYRYMAPEVFYGKSYTSKCDVYSFGICLWEIYCCDVPYKDVPFETIKSERVYKDLMLKIPKCCPKSLKNVIKRCWDMDPEKRPTMKEVVSMLKAIDISKGRGMTPLIRSPGCFCWNL